MENMKKVELEKTIGGINLSGSILNHLTGLIKYVYVLGQSLGSSLRRIATKKVCRCK